MPPWSWTSVRSIPAAGLAVVPFFTVPRTVPAFAIANGARTNAPSSAKRALFRIIGRSGPLPRPGARRAAAAPETPSPARFRQAPAPPHFQGPFSWLQNHLRNIFRNDTQNAGRASYHGWCRDAPAADRALSGAAQDPRHPAEYKK